MTHIRVRTLAQAGASKMQCVELMDGERLVRELVPPTYNPVWGMARSWADTLNVPVDEEMAGTEGGMDEYHAP